MHNQTSTGADSALKHTTIRETLAAAGFNVSYVPLKGKGDTGLGREIRADRAAEKAILPSSHPKAIYRNATPEEAKRGVAYVRNSDGAEFDRKMNPIVPSPEIPEPRTITTKVVELNQTSSWWLGPFTSQSVPISVELTKEESSCVRRLLYDEDAQALRVLFHDNPVIYIYKAVTPAEHAELLQAESIGKHFNRRIKPTHEVAKILPTDPDPKTPAPLALDQTVRDQCDSTQVAAGLALRLQGVRDENSTSGKAPAGPWVYSVLQTYAVRVRTHDLESFRRAYGFHASDDETLDFFLSSAEALWNSDWIPFAEALRLDDEASQYQPVAAGLALRSNIEAAA